MAQLGAYIREQRENAQYSLRQLAQAAGVSNPYLSQIERGLRKPSAEILQQLAKALEISAETLYVRAGLLDGAESPHGDGDGSGYGNSDSNSGAGSDGDGAGHVDGSPSAASSAGSSAASTSGSVTRVNRVIAAIAEDPALTRRQKQILREIYESFRAEPAVPTDPEPGDSAPTTDTGLDAPPRP